MYAVAIRPHTEIPMSAIMITIGTLAPGGAEHLEHYAAAVIPLLEAAGVTILGRFQGVEAIIGNTHPDLVALFEFKDREQMRHFMTSDAYRATSIHRDRAFARIESFACDRL